MSKIAEDKSPEKKKSTKQDSKSVTEQHAYSSLSISSLNVKDLEGGHLMKVMALSMLRNAKDRNRFLQSVAKEKGKYSAILQHYETLYGYAPSPECEEWAEVAKTYSRFHFSIPEVWSFTRGLSNYQNRPIALKVDKIINDWFEVMTLLTGLEMFGQDGCGDSCFMSVLPSALNTTAIYYFNHENGEIENCMNHSIAGFVAETWGDKPYEGDDEERSNNRTDDTGFVSKDVLKNFSEKAEDVLRTRPFYHDPESLFWRSHWLIGHPLGTPTFQFAEKMAHAPTFADWQEELTLLSTEPVLANYWLLAHYFLDNVEACRSTIEQARNSPAIFTSTLSILIEKLLDQPEKAKLGKLTPEELRSLKQETRKNCLPEHLTPHLRDALAAERGENNIRKLSDEAYAQHLKDGTDLWTLINEYPDDLKLHDKILKRIAKSDESLGGIIGQYFSERTSDYFNEWPYDIKEDHRKLSLPITAAFRSGLKFDVDHASAFAGLTRTVGMLDDDYAMQAYRDALEKLNPDDSRLEYVIEELTNSSHPKAREVMRIGAWKFFDHYDTTVKSVRKTEAEGPNLNNIFKEHSHLRNAVERALRYSDDDSVKLAEKVLSFTSDLRVLGQAIGHALRVIGDHNLHQYKGYAEMYCTATAGLNSEYLDKNGCFNVAEAAIAYTKLAPDEAHQMLKKIFYKKYTSHFRMLDMRASVLAGLLILEPSNTDYLYWAERILANRSGEFRVYGVLRGIEEGKVKGAAPWARYHVYADPDPMVDYTSLIIEDAARNAIKAALNETLPPFDPTNKYASGLKPELLPDAITQPEKYYTDHVFQKIAEKKYKHPKIVRNAADYLIASLRYTKDEQKYSGEDARWKAIKALIAQGENALPEFAKILDLPEINPAWYANIRYTMRVIEPEINIIEWLLHATPAMLNDQLAKPSPRFIPWLDFIAAFALVYQGGNAKDHIEKALHRRYHHVPKDEKYPGWIDLEPTAVRLPSIYAHFGMSSVPVLQRINEAIKKCYQAKNHLSAGLKLAQTTKDLQTVKYPSVGNEVTMRQKIKGDDSDSPDYAITIKQDDKNLAIQCVTDGLYFQSVVPDQHLESENIVRFDNKEQASKKSDELVKALTIMGYRPGTKKPKKR